MNARQAVLENELMVSQLIEGARRVSVLKNITLEEAIDFRVNVAIDFAKSDSEKHAWEIRGEEAKKQING